MNVTPDSDQQPTPARVSVKAGQSPRYIEPRPKSRIRNGKKILPSAHPQSVWARLMRDVMGAVVQHCGGPEYVSETQRLAIRRVATLEAELIHLEDQFGRARQSGEIPPPADLTLYATMANAQRRFCEALGWRPTPRDVTSSLSALLEQANNMPLVASGKPAGALNAEDGR